MRLKAAQAGVYKMSGCQVIVSKDAGLWHISISRKNRLPSYEDLKEARYRFLPNVRYVAQILPPEDEFVNLHEYCLHLWELGKDETYSDKRAA